MIFGAQVKDMEQVSSTTYKLGAIMNRLLQADGNKAVQQYYGLMQQPIQRAFQTLKTDKALCQQVLDNGPTFCKTVQGWTHLAIQRSDVDSVLYSTDADVPPSDKEFVLFGVQALALKFGALLFTMAKALQQTTHADAQKLVNELLATYYSDVSQLLG